MSRMGKKVGILIQTQADKVNKVNKVNKVAGVWWFDLLLR